MDSDWQVIGAAVQGLSHQKQGLPCQDALKYHCLPGGILLVVLADGAGSAVHAELGAQAAVRAALEWLTLRLENERPSECCEWAELIWETFQNARTAVERLAQVEYDEPSRSFATTLTCLVATPEQLVVGQLGDGAVVAAGEDGSLRAVTTLQRGEYANETNFLTQDDALDLIAIQVIDEQVRELAVMSDGLTRLALKRPGNEPHPPFFKPLFAFVGSSASANDPARANGALMEFLSSPRVCERTDDDKTLVLARRSD
ncbi:MAG: PP2C family serine/threonine-protein phosphatase [Bacteroidota bacterium]